MSGRRKLVRWFWERFAALGVSLAVLLASCAGGDGGTGPAVSGGAAGTSGPASVEAANALSFSEQKHEINGNEVSISCMGRGDKAVVLLGDIGQDGAQGWGNSEVPAGLAVKATVCIYDRPGLGASAAGTMPRSIENQASELGALITAAGLKAPVYLVAQGYGTLIARRLAKDNRTQVAGMVLVDPPMWGLDLKAADGASPGVLAEYAYLPQLNKDLALYGSGALPPGPIPIVVLGTDGSKDPLPDSLDSSAPFTPTTTTFPLPPIEKRHEDQRQLAQKSPFGKFEVVDGAGSYVQYWKPGAVVAAAEKVLANNSR